MQIASLNQKIEYKENRPSISVLLETDTTKEIRIAFKQGQNMKEHKASYPIVIEIFEGEISFGVNGVIHDLRHGDIISLNAFVAHDLYASRDSIVRLSISKQDRVERVEKVLK